jgi:effector-binding domain-containing protein
MSNLFSAISSASFAMDNTDQNVTIEGVSFSYPYGGNREDYALKAIIEYIEDNICELSGVMLALIWIETSPAKTV